MKLIEEIVNKIKFYPKPISCVYINFHTYNMLKSEIENLSDIEYNYYSNLGLENIYLIIDNELQDNQFKLKC